MSYEKLSYEARIQFREDSFGANEAWRFYNPLKMTISVVENFEHKHFGRLMEPSVASVGSLAILENATADFVKVAVAAWTACIRPRLRELYALEQSKMNKYFSVAVKSKKNLAESLC